MKKLVSFIVVVLSVLVLVACGRTNPNPIDNDTLNLAYEALELKYALGETKDSIKSNFSLPLFVADYPDVSVTWTSSDDKLLKPSGLTAVVYLPQSPSEVVLTAKLSLNTQSKDKLFNLTLAGYTDYEFSGYYESLSGLSLEAFKVELTDMIRTTGRATGTTAQVRTIDSFEGQNYNIYTGFGAYGNREHVWPQSHLGSIKDDLHNLRAAVSQVNSTRGNRHYSDYEAGGTWRTVGNGFYPGEEHIGDVARIILYVYIRYDLNIQLVGNLELFLKWHEMDPVSAFEISRNNKIESIQQNRNPFIDYPELVNIYFK